MCATRAQVAGRVHRISRRAAQRHTYGHDHASDRQAADGTDVKTYTTDDDGVVLISGGADFDSETLYYVVETTAPTHYLLPVEEERTYFYFCNDTYLIPTILADLPEGETAVNLTETYESLTIDRPSIRNGETLRVKVRVRNTGNREGKETVQLYMRDLVASVVRPVQQLIDYKKISLAPGESREVEFTVTEEQLRFWNFDCELVSEPGEFELSTGFADHLLLTKRFELV